MFSGSAAVGILMTLPQNVRMTLHEAPSSEGGGPAEDLRVGLKLAPLLHTKAPSF